jgi:hypothetical protein
MPAICQNMSDFRKLEADKGFDDMKQRLTEMQTGIERRLERIETQLDKHRKAYRSGIEAWK